MFSNRTKMIYGYSVISVSTTGTYKNTNAIYRAAVNTVTVTGS